MGAWYRLPGGMASNKAEAERLIFEGDNSYSSATEITAGILELGAAERIGDSSALRVSAGASLTLSGALQATAGFTTSRAITLNAGGGTIAPGSGGAGLLSTGALNQNSGAHFALEIGGTAPGTQYDQAAVTGGVTLAGGLSARQSFHFASPRLRAKTAGL